MAIATAVSKETTLQEFLALPETKPASEFIDGQITSIEERDYCIALFPLPKFS